MRVCLEDALDPHAALAGCVEVPLDREPGVDDDRHTGLEVADEVRGTAEIPVHELPEQRHGS